MRTDKNLDRWVSEITGDDSWREIAKKLSTTHPTIKRRLDNAEADAIIELAGTYGANPVDGLIAAGAISDIDVRSYARTFLTEDLSDVELAEIIVERLQARENNERSNTSDDDVHPGLYSVADSSEDEEEGDPGDYDA